MLSNTPQSYGGIARAFHWLSALLIAAAIALGLYGAGLPTGSDAQAAAAIRIYSLHKTIGVAAFGVALARILWALTQHRPAALNPGRRLETTLAEVVHWALYGAMLVMPASGWVHHAAQAGYAPILWPLGQGLPFVPQSAGLAHAAGLIHAGAAWVLYGAIGLHVAGALKHALIDRDATLARMLRGVAAGQPGRHRAAVLAPLAALALWAGVIAAPVLTAAPADQSAAATVTPMPQAARPGTWAVAGGTLDFTLRQMGAAVTGNLPRWTAAIDFDPATGAGQVSVTIDTTALALGAVSDQARGAEFFDTAGHPVAVFAATIAPATIAPVTGPHDAQGAATHLATGMLTLRGVSVPVTLPFHLTVADDSADMQGRVTLDRRDFGMGASYPDEATVGFAVEVAIRLHAIRTVPATAGNSAPAI